MTTTYPTDTIQIIGTPTLHTCSDEWVMPTIDVCNALRYTLDMRALLKVAEPVVAVSGEWLILRPVGRPRLAVRRTDIRWPFPRKRPSLRLVKSS